MRRLYKCSATCSTHDLVSYNTRLFWSDYPYYILYLYPSNTSKMHIRKFIQWLYDNGCDMHADMVQHMYNLGIKSKKLFVVYDLISDEYKAVEDYHNFVK